MPKNGGVVAENDNRIKKELEDTLQLNLKVQNMFHTDSRHVNMYSMIAIELIKNLNMHMPKISQSFKQIDLQLEDTLQKIKETQAIECDHANQASALLKRQKHIEANIKRLYEQEWQHTNHISSHL